MSLMVKNLQEYLALPLEQRERRVYWWPFKWYIEPFSLEVGGWEWYDAYIETHYPVQFFLRDTLYFFFYRWRRRYRDLKWKIKHRIKNPRKEMRDKVFPPEYRDLQEHIVEFHVQCVIEFVEREKCFENTDYDWCPEYQRFAAELREAYDYCKNGRTLLKNKLEEAWNRFDHQSDATFEVVYKEVNEQEAWNKECDTKLCKWVIENRESLWT